MRFDRGRRLLTQLRSAARSTLECIPTVCLLCGELSPGGFNLCAACAADLPRANGCPHCGRLAIESDRPCRHCRLRPPLFARCRPALRYEAPVKQLIADFKFRHRLEVGYALSRLLATTINADQDPGQRPQWLLPVPLHPRRERERGFNQAREIARTLSSRCDIPLARGWVRRCRPTQAQSLQTSRAARLRNLRGAFAVDRSRLPEEVVSVALVDDVVTTMATVDSLSRCLRRTGIAHIEVWCLARAEQGDSGVRSKTK